MRAGLAARGALCLSLATSALGIGCSTGVISFVSNTSDPSATSCSEENGAECSAAQRVCEPGARQCSSDFSQVETCDTAGAAWVQSKKCAARETCVAAACVEAAKVLGRVMVLGPADNKEVPLPAGKYGLAVVNNVIAPTDRELPFPVQISGELLVQAAPVAQAQACPVPSFVHRSPRWQPRTGEQALAEHALAAATSPTQPVYKVGDQRVFNFYDDPADGSHTRVLKKQTGELRHSGTNVNIWEDVTTAGKGSVINDADLSELARRVDTGAVPRDVAIFGAPTDVDGNGKVDVFLTALQAGKGAFTFTDTLYPPGFYPDVDSGEIIYSCGPSKDEPITWLAGTVAHELAHLIYYGVQLRPYLDPPRKSPNFSDEGRYLSEGLAALAQLLSGQEAPMDVHFALSFPEHWTLGRLFNTEYATDYTVNAALYGLATLIVAYFFEQAGGIEITSSASVTDHGGQAFLKQVFAGTDGLKQLALADGRGIQQAYVEMAAAVLRGSLAESLPSPSGEQLGRYAFQPVQRDPVFGAFVGVAQRHDEYFPDEQAQPALKRLDWSLRSSTLLEGGAAFHDLVVGQEGATLKNTDANTHVVLLRYSDLK